MNSVLSETKWFALVVKPRHEKVVCRIIERKGYESFLPLYQHQRRYAHRTRQSDLPLFPGYIFCRFDPLHRLPILTTPGVNRIVSNGHSPVPVDSSEMQFLQAAVAAKIPLAPYPYLQAGQQVRITDGALADTEGILVKIKESFRLVLSVSLLQRSVLLEIDASRVEVLPSNGLPRNQSPPNVAFHAAYGSGDDRIRSRSTELWQPA